MERHPALYYGFAAISGVALAYGIWPPLFLILFGINWVQRVGFLLITLFISIETLYFMPILPKKIVNGIGYYQIEKVRKYENSIGYHGKLKCFATDTKIYY